MNQKKAYERFSQHIDHWIEFLETAINKIDEDAQNDAQAWGERTKKNRQLQHLYEVKVGAVNNPKLMDKFIYPESITEKEIPMINRNSFVQTLDYHQTQALSKAMASDDLCMIQGPPGTGKTTVITELCLQILERDPGAKILMVSETHVAVDNILEKFQKLTDQGAIGNIHALRAYERSDDETSNHRFYLEDYRNEYLEDLKNTGVHEDIQKLMTYILNKEDDEKQLTKELMMNVDVVGVTCNSVPKVSYSVDEYFDYVIVDEVCKATLPEVLIPLTISNQAVLVGDPKQLPPMFMQEDREIIRQIEKSELDKYMYLDELFNRVPNSQRQFLKKQYRMTNEIAAVISQHFYEGELENGRNDSIQDSILWVDYSPSKPWGNNEGSPYNEEEVGIVRKLLEHENKRHKKLTVAVISPYRGQTRKLKSAVNPEEFSNLDISIDTVDAFQGKDADIVIFNITRTTGSLRFFSDSRRLNVALSRSKDMCYIVGYSTYARKNATLRSIHEKVTAHTNALRTPIAS